MSSTATLPSDTPPSQGDPAPGSGAMSLTDHLDELRRRIIAVVVTLAVCVVASFFAALPVIEWMKSLVPPDVAFIQLTPGEVLMTSFRMSFFLGTVLASPVILYQVLRFTLPGLTNTERKFLFGVVAGGSVLFALGVVFSWWAVVPSALGYLLSYGQHVAESQISIARYVDFCMALLALTGILFELPMMMFLLSFTGLVKSEQLVRQWRVALVAVFVLAAVVTPSQDPVSMLMVAGAMAALYFVSIIPIRLIGR